MSLPPQILRIKRKRDEEPVEALYLENKRRVTEHDFVFRRLVTPRKSSAIRPPVQRAPVPAPSAQSRGVPQLLTTQPGEENGFIARHRQISKEGANQSDSIRESPPAKTNLNPEASVSVQSALPRRFHLSSASLVPQPGHRKKDVAVFVEKMELDTVTDTPRAEEGQPRKLAGTLAEAQDTLRPRRRPGANAATPIMGTPRKAELKEINPEMQEALQRYALEELGVTYGQRGVSKAPDAIDTDIDMEDAADDGDYIYDTYVRHATAVPSVKASTMMETQPFAPGDITGGYGILVIPEEQQDYFLETYGEDADEEDEGDWDSEQDDENAENYYAADYPEDEVDSDDERGAGAYLKYNTGGGASDDEDYDDSDDGAYDGDEAQAGDAPWAHQRWDVLSAHEERQTRRSSNTGVVSEDD